MDTALALPQLAMPFTSHKPTWRDVSLNLKLPYCRQYVRSVFNELIALKLAIEVETAALIEGFLTPF